MYFWGRKNLLRALCPLQKHLVRNGHRVLKGLPSSTWLCEFPCDSLPSLLTRATNLKPTDSWREAVNFLTTFILQCLAKVYMKSWKTQNSISCCFLLYQPHHLFIISHYIFDFLVLFCLPSWPAVPILALLMTVLQQLNGQLCSPSGLSEEPLTCATKSERRKSLLGI